MSLETVAISLVAPSVLVVAFFLYNARAEFFTGLAVVLGALVAPFSAGWLLHDASLSGNLAPYAAISWSGVFWGCCFIRLFDHRRLVASQKLIDHRIMRLEEEERRLSVEVKN